LGTGFPANTRWLEVSHPSGLLNFLPVAFFALLATNVWLGWPFMTVVATGALQSIPSELYEAADIDGANGWQKFWSVTVPLIRPAMVPAIMLGTIWTFNQFNVIYFISEGGPFGRTEILVTQAFKLVYEQRLYGVAAAFSIVVFFVLLIITLINNRVTRATEAYNA
jgi:arabinogalactan oligomer/maltooligosaccharide transport system permease protein